MNEQIKIPQIKNEAFNSISMKIRQVWALCMKNIHLYFRKGPVLIFGMLFPFFIALTWVIGREITSARMFIGISSMSIFFTSTAISPVILPWETREKGLERQFTSPVSINLILWGIVVASVLYSILVSALVMFLLGIVVGIYFETLLAFAGFSMGLLLIALNGSLIGVLISAPPTDQLPDIMTIANLIKFPLIFFSGIFIPLSQLAPGVQDFAWFSPLTPFVDLVASCINDDAILPFYIDLAILLVWFGVLYTVSWTAQKKTFRRRFSR